MQTPYYEIQEEKLDADIACLQKALRESWGNNTIAACSVKTNSLPWLLNHFREKGLWGEVVSESEYELVRRLGFDPSRIIYNGPVKDRLVFEQVLQDGGLVNLDSSEELDWLEELDRESEEASPAARRSLGALGKTRIRIGLRVNVDYARLLPSEIPADAEGSRFGYSEENGELARVVQRLRQLRHVDIVGLHLHSSTKSRSVAAYEAVADFAGRLAQSHQLTSLSYIDMGGGFYGGVAGKPDFGDYVPAIAGRLRNYFDPEKVTLILEPGVSMVSSSFCFVTSVRDVKHIGSHTYVVTDGSRLNLNPQVTRRWYPHHIEYEAEALHLGPSAIEKDKRERIPSQMICGATCMEYDRLFEVTGEPALKKGDRVVYDLAGGYTICLTPLFIHYFPAVVVRKADGTEFLARRPWTNDDFLAGNNWEEEHESGK